MLKFNNMKIALTTIGSRGDIQPYIALGLALKSKGEEVLLVTHPWAKDLVETYQLQHVPVGDDIDIHSVAKKFVDKSGDGMKGLAFALQFIFTELKKCHSGFLRVLKDMDLVVGHGIVGSSEAEMLHKPFVSVSIETMGLKKEYWKSKNILKELGIYLGDYLKGALFGRPYINFRKEIGAPPLSSKKQFPHLAIVPISTSIQKPNPHWEPITEITGYLFADTPPHYNPPEELKRFLESGEKPIFITFGSMFHKEEEALKLVETMCQGLSTSSSKAILLMPSLNIKKESIPDYIFLMDHIPYRYLLPRVKLVIHHFGFGTTAEVLRAGLPSIPVPHLFDQKQRARQIYKLGLSHKPLDVRTLTGSRLASAITKVQADKKLITTCKETGIKIANEHGAERAAKLILKYSEHVYPKTK